MQKGLERRLNENFVGNIPFINDNSSDAESDLSFFFY